MDNVRQPAREQPLARGRQPRRTSRRRRRPSPPGTRGRPGSAPSLAFAALLAVLSVSAPLLPASHTAVLLLCAGSGLAPLRTASISQPADASSEVRLRRRHRHRPARTHELPDLRNHACRAAVESDRKPSLSPRPSRPKLGELMARVSHDLRTPLNAVIGFSDVMDRSVRADRRRPLPGVRLAHPRQRRELLKSAEDTLAITALVPESDAAMQPAPATWSCWSPMPGPS